MCVTRGLERFGIFSGKLTMAREAEIDDEETKEGDANEESSEDGDERELRERRRALERRAFARHDSTTIDRRRQCWFLVDRLWADRGMRSGQSQRTHKP